MWCIHSPFYCFRLFDPVLLIVDTNFRHIIVFKWCVNIMCYSLWSSQRAVSICYRISTTIFFFHLSLSFVSVFLLLYLLSFSCYVMCQTRKVNIIFKSLFFLFSFPPMCVQRQLFSISFLRSIFFMLLIWKWLNAKNIQSKWFIISGLKNKKEKHFSKSVSGELLQAIVIYNGKRIYKKNNTTKCRIESDTSRQNVLSKNNKRRTKTTTRIR